MERKDIVIALDYDESNLKKAFKQIEQYVEDHNPSGNNPIEKSIGVWGKEKSYYPFICEAYSYPAHSWGFDKDKYISRLDFAKEILQIRKQLIGGFYNDKGYREEHKERDSRSIKGSRG